MRKIWRRIRFLFNVRKSVPFLWEFFTTRQVPIQKKILSVGFLILYIVIPFDIIPDFLVFFGVLDDVTIFTFVLQQIVKMAPPSLQDKYDLDGQART
ncbi:membrane protein [Pontibacillus chungwhensis BH030062]|uniref:Membrane protein n=2 Tax=Pontibacillus TaxID=289201 RepID=A0A0A2UQ91_9BACI|nr:MULTISPECIES: DUF1232 domain-containing protein [Pontibacillus]KGP90124.1 membrane protein [Pontibacillus chungwhensis BH030062]GGD29170.1 membrane protein [Pontibacillus salipaludis]